MYEEMELQSTVGFSEYPEGLQEGVMIPGVMRHGIWKLKSQMGNAMLFTRLR